MPLPSINPPPVQHRWYVWTVLFLVLSAGATGLGLRLAPYIAIKAGQRPVAMSIHPTPEAKIPDAWRSLITGAKSDIFISAGQLSSETLANDLDTAARNGVSVVLILPKDSYPDANSGLRLWLAEKKSPIAVALDPAPFTGVMCVIDGRIALVTTQPLASTDAITKLGGFFASFTDPFAIQEIRKLLRDQVSRSTQS